MERCGDAEVLWADLLGRGTRQPAFRVVRQGTTLPARAVTRSIGMGNHNLGDAVDPNRVLAEYRAGATVVLQGLHHTDRQMARLATNLALALDHPTQVNAYCSPPNARGLDLHFDYHDVFVVQLAGAKRWRVWERLERAPTPVRGTNVPLPTLAELGDPLIDVQLMPGDCLYLPRGFPHAAETVETASDHLTIGLVTVNWVRVVRKALDQELAAGRFTESLPAGLLRPGAPPVDLPDTSSVTGQLTPAQLRDWLAREIWRRQPSTRWIPRQPPTLAEDSRLAFTPGPLLWLTHQGGRAVLGLGERMLDLPDEAVPFLADLLTRPDGFAPGELHGLDAASTRVVLQRLMDEGVLVDAR